MLLGVESITLSAGAISLLIPDNLKTACPELVLREVLSELRRKATHSEAPRYKVASALVTIGGSCLLGTNFRSHVSPHNLCAEFRLLVAAANEARFALCVNFLSTEGVHPGNTSCGICLQELSHKAAPELNGDMRIVSVMPFNESMASCLTSQHPVLSFSELESDGARFLVNQAMGSGLLPAPWRHLTDPPKSEC